MNLKTWLLILTLGALLFSGCAILKTRKPPAPGQSHQKFRLKSDPNVQIQYLLFLPEGYYQSEKEWPLIFFLHGADERGDSLDLVKKHGPPKIVEEKQDFPFIVVSPQCPAGEWWPTPALMPLLDNIVEKYRVDSDRIYLTGLSMGGFGTWALAMESGSVCRNRTDLRWR